jgi:hypothetical protein
MTCVMAAWVSAVNGREATTSPRDAKRVLRAAAIVLLIALATALGGALLWRLNRVIVPGVFALAVSTGMGSWLAGIVRRMLPGPSAGATRLWTALAAEVVALLAWGLLTGGAAGIILHLPPLPSPDWYGLTQLTFGLAAVVLTLSAWRSSRGAPAAGIDRALTASTLTPAISDPTPTQPIRTTAIRHAGTPAAAHIRVANEPRPAPQSRLGVGRFRWPAWPRFPFLPTGRLSWRRRRVQLVGSEEHRCPYCLEIVEKDDPRGVVVCRVCHTRHHGDCWAETGMCQVPHYHK